MLWGGGKRWCFPSAVCHSVRSLETLRSFAKTNNIADLSAFGRWKLSGIHASMGWRGVAALLNCSNSNGWMSRFSILLRVVPFSSHPIVVGMILLSFVFMVLRGSSSSRLSTSRRAVWHEMVMHAARVLRSPNLQCDPWHLRGEVNRIS